MRRELESTLAAPPRLSITSSPRGATVKVDGEAVGKTPLEITTVPGTHRVEISRPGFVSERREVELVDGVRRELEFPLRPQPKADDPAGDERKAKVFIGTGAGLLVAGIGGVAAGGVLLAIDDEPIESQCTGGDVDELGRCRWLHDTFAGGVAAVAVGGAGVVAGAVLLGIGIKRRRASRVAVFPTGYGLAMRGRF
jgi:hypothetical protein